MKNEIYKLTFEHYILDDEDGKKVRIDDPISVQYVISMPDGVSLPIVINNMIEEMKRYLLEKIDKNEEA